MRGYRLLPYERRFADFMLRRQSRPTGYQARLQQRFGPDGMLLYGAYLIDRVLGQACALAGIVLFMVFVILNVPWLPVPYVVMGAGLSALGLALVRIRQAVRAGRVFRSRSPEDPGARSVSAG
jgi:hypothetical protein